MMSETITYDEIIDKGLQYNFVPYEIPRLATYFHRGEEYDIKKGGWQNIPKTILVIGEDEHCFITKLSPGEHGEWTDKRILYKYILPIGFHKSRFIRWEETQLSLF